MIKNHKEWWICRWFCYVNVTLKIINSIRINNEEEWLNYWTRTNGSNKEQRTITKNNKEQEQIIKKAITNNNEEKKKLIITKNKNK